MSDSLHVSQEYGTDSDVDDPKYTVTKHTLPTLPNEEAFQNQPSSHQEMLLNSVQNKINCLRNDNELKLKNQREIENENNLLRNELLTIQRQIESKDKRIAEHENLMQTSLNKLKLVDEINSGLKKEKAQLLLKIAELEKEINNQKLKEQQNESNAKSTQFYLEHINELENQISQNENKFIKKFQEKEQSLKKEFMTEITGLRKELDEAISQNEKLKFEISNYKINITTLTDKIEEKEMEYKSLINKKEKEVSRLTEKITENERAMNEKDSIIQTKLANSETQISSLKEENNSITNELNAKNDTIYELETKIGKLVHEIKLLSSEIEENKDATSNKDNLIEQLKSQIETQKKEILEKDNELELINQEKAKVVEEARAEINEIVSKKNDLELENTELKEYIEVAKEKLLKNCEFIRNEYSACQKSLFKERSKNENLEKKYRGIIRQLREKEKHVVEENKSLRDLVKERDIEKEQIEYHYQNELKNLSLYNNISMTHQPAGNSMMLLGNTNINSSTNNILPNENINNSWYMQGGNPNIYRFEDPKEESQKKTLEDFKQLLNKIDEKLDLPVSK